MIDIAILLLALPLTALVYLIFPIIYVGIFGTVSPKKGKKLALLNSISCGIIFFILTIILATSVEDVGSEISGYNLGPAFFYFFIAKSILTSKNPTDKNTEKNETEDEKPENNEENGDGLAETDKTRSE